MCLSLRGHAPLFSDADLSSRTVFVTDVLRLGELGRMRGNYPSVRHAGSSLPSVGPSFVLTWVSGPNPTYDLRRGVARGEDLERTALAKKKSRARARLFCHSSSDELLTY
jgi:hypothetical protein